jgi:hypothetical protein
MGYRKAASHIHMAQTWFFELRGNVVTVSYMVLVVQCSLTPSCTWFVGGPLGVDEDHCTTLSIYVSRRLTRHITRVGASRVSA